MSASDLGLARATWSTGVRWGGVCAAVLAAVYGVALLIPAARDMVSGTAPGWAHTLLAVLW